MELRMGTGFWAGVLVAIGCAASVTSDLKRATTRLPRPPYRSPTYLGMNQVLNVHLRRLVDVSVDPCEDFSIDAVHDVLGILFAARDSQFEDIYSRVGDSRSLEAAHASKHFQVLEERLLLAHPKLHDMLRNARCHEAVMWYVHHLNQSAREELHELITLPLLPISQHNTSSPIQQLDVHKRLPDAPTEEVLQSEHLSLLWARQQYVNALSCQDCHNKIDPKPTKHPLATPSNYVTTNYLYAPAHGSTISRTEYRYEPVKQVMYTTLWAERKVSRDCVLLFDSDESVWEWYTESKQCAKLMEHVPVFTPGWATHANMTLLVQSNLSVINLWTNSSRYCNLYCAPQRGPCYCENLDGPPWQPVLHTHNKQDLNDSRTYYDQFVPTPSLTSRLKRPEYCPDQSSLPKFKPDITGLENSCNKAWYSNPDTTVYRYI